jgi:nitroimidazol reductase NimA-like FMN-containing flavoprotein (pyridoxamine 5'-phosphate oxidase superfamily)
MSSAEIEEFLALPLVPVLSVSRRDRGPVAVPIWYGYEDGVFSFITARDSVHGRLMQQTGRATLTFHDEDYGARQTLERYVHAEGPVEFCDDDITPVVLAHRRRYYTGPNAETWISEPLTELNYRQNIARLRPERLSGHYWAVSV